jgi:membrane peptidoglycan carboxypeptidase
MLSRNVPAVRVGKAVGIDNVVETARLAGITSKLDPNLSLSLGSSAVTPYDMAGAYATFARGGIAVKPSVLRRIENNRGQVIEQFEPHYDKVFDTDAVANLVSIMQDVVAHGTGAAARLPDRPVAGKTGTADAAKDIWFCGYTPDTVVTLWGGNDENLPIPGHNVTGGGVMAKIWKDFMTAYYKMRPTPPGSFVTPTKKIDDLGEQNATVPSGIDNGMPKLVPINPDTGAAMYPNEHIGGSEATPGTTPDDRGAPPPAVSPTEVIPTQQDFGGGAPPPTLAPVPSQPQPAPNVVPPVTAPIPAGPLGSAPIPMVAPAYGAGAGNVSASRLSAPQVVLTSEGRTKKTIINEEPPTRYSSITDPAFSPGLHRKRFAPGGATSTTAPGF